MSKPSEVRCEACGTVHYPDDRAWTKCDCGSRVYFREDLRNKHGNPIPPKFRDRGSKSGGSEDDDDDDDGTEPTSLDNF